MDNPRPFDPREPMGQQQAQWQAAQQPSSAQQPQFPGQQQPPWQGQQPQFPGQQPPWQGQQPQFPGQQQPPWQGQQPQFPGQQQPPWQGQQVQQWQAPQQPSLAQQPQFPGQVMTSEPPKDWITAALLCQFLGWLGVHRFYTGRIISGIFQLITFGGCGIWVLIDLIMIITGDFKDKYGRPLYHREVVGGDKSWVTTALLCMFLGGWGVHRFYTGHIVTGILQLLTGGGFVIWALVDLILIYTDNFTDGNGMPLSRGYNRG